MFSAGEIERLSEEFETKTPQEIIQWAVNAFWPQVALSSSFQTQSVPLLHMASLVRRDIQKYAKERRLPAHPLLQRGYRSIGCAPCTIAIGLTDDERAGRWSGRGKIECGLHTEMFQHKDMADLKSDFRIDPTDVKQ